MQKALADVDSLLFDPQGRVLIEIALSEEEKSLWSNLDFKPASKTTISLDALAFPAEPQLQQAYVHQYALTERQFTQLKEFRGSLIPLQQEYYFHLGLVSRVYTAANPEKFPVAKMEEAHHKAMSRVQELIKAEFRRALNQATQAGIISSELLVRELDSARRNISSESHAILLEEIVRTTGVSLSKNEFKEISLQHIAEITTATRNDLLHIDAQLGQVTWIAGTDVTAHDRGMGEHHLADRQIATYALNEEHQSRSRLQIRTPSLDVKKGIKLQEAINDVCAKLRLCFLAQKLI